MLNPDSRQLYIEALKPPANYKFDKGIATTFSLDLMTLLVAPLSLAMFDCNEEQDFITNPIAVLEALRRVAKNLTVFCQRGRIAIPAKDSLLYSYLEDMVVEVTPQNNRGGVFHPKIWLIRYVSDVDVPMYKFICLSRNITFDKSWDTILILEGKVTDKVKEQNEPLVEFIGKLPQLAYNKTSMKNDKNVTELILELGKVDFIPPPGFNEVRFWPIGINEEEFPCFNECERLLVLSPFLSDDLLNSFNDVSDKILISRTESLDAIEEATGAKFNELWVLDELAEKHDEESPLKQEADSANEFDEKQILSGLHAKLYFAEYGNTAKLWTGSANATCAAFKNINVEFLVELVGNKISVGIDQFLGKDNKASFHSLLKPYTVPKEKTESTLEEQLKKKIDKTRDLIANLIINAKVVPVDDSRYDLIISANSDEHIRGNLADIAGSCWPITLKKEMNAKSILPLLIEGEAIFKSLSLAALTSFLAFEISTQEQETKANLTFVLNLPITGLPSTRDQNILNTIITDRSSFIRYLLFLLAEGDDIYNVTHTFAKTARGTGSKQDSFYGIPLMEELLKALSRNPGKIDSIGKLIDDLRNNDKGETVLPEDFDIIWEAIWKAHLRRKKP